MSRRRLIKFVGHGKPSSLYFPSQTDTIEAGTVPLFRKFVNKDKCHLHLVFFRPVSLLIVDPGVLHIIAYAGRLRPKSVADPGEGPAGPARPLLIFRLK